MDLLPVKVRGLEGREEVGIFLGMGGKGHAEALMNVIKVAQPEPPGAGTVGVVTDVD
jgi:hypothetical protein